MFHLFIATYGAILVSELIGDKNLYTISSLAMRFSAFRLLCGLSAAFGIKTAVAVFLGRVIAELPALLVAITSTATFFVTALIIWFKRSGNAPEETASKTNSGRAALIVFGAIFFSEWGDVGQIMAATLSARYQSPFIVWAGATSALITKGALAIAIGFGLRRRIPVRIARHVSAILCVILGVISAINLVIQL